MRQPQVVRPVGSEKAHSLSELLEQEGARAGSRLLSFETVRAARKIAEHLGLRIGQPVVVTRRLRLANEQPFCVEVSYIPQELVPGFAAADLIEAGSLYSLLRERYGINPVRSEGTVSVSRATADEAELLGVGVDSPVLLLRSVVFDEAGRRVEYLKSVNHPDRVVLRTTGAI